MIGSTDAPLSSEGLGEANDLAKKLSGLDWEVIFTSPLTRAKQTAQIIAQSRKLTPIIVEEFREINLGLFEGFTAREAQSKYPSLWDQRGLNLYAVAPPGGESYGDLAHRVLPAFEKALSNYAQAQKALLVAHRAVIQVILASQRNLPMSEAPKIPIGYGELVTLERL
jgi:broad specificity phosphatase PhoE